MRNALTTCELISRKLISWEDTNLITSDCIVKLYLSNPSNLPRGFDCRVCPTIGAIDVLISQIPIWEGVEHNIDRHINKLLKSLKL